MTLRMAKHWLTGRRTNGPHPSRGRAGAVTRCIRCVTTFKMQETPAAVGLSPLASDASDNNKGRKKIGTPAAGARPFFSQPFTFKKSGASDASGDNADLTGTSRVLHLVTLSPLIWCKSGDAVPPRARPPYPVPTKPPDDPIPKLHPTATHR